MKIAIAPNLVKKQAAARAEKAAAVLRKAGCQTVFITGLYQKGSQRQEAVDQIGGCDLLLAVGGDGTIICAAKTAAGLDLPVLGVNAGKLGFNAGVEWEEIQLLARLAEAHWREERRMMLKVELVSGERRQSFQALNDAVVSAELSTIIEYRMAIGSGLGYAYRADGFIIATPTGSTAYSLSAGGPVIEPTLDCMIYTPICPHSLFNRSVVFAPNTRLMVEIPKNRGRLFLTVDGEEPVELQGNDRLIFEKSLRSARFIRLTENSFYDTLNHKLLEHQ